MAKAELWRYPLVRWAMEAYGTFPVERGDGDTGAMARAGELLEAGEILGMFRAGTSSPRPARTGTAAPRGSRSRTARPSFRATGEHEAARTAPPGRGARRRAVRRAVSADDRGGARADRARKVGPWTNCERVGGLRDRCRHRVGADALLWLVPGADSRRDPRRRRLGLRHRPARDPVRSPGRRRRRTASSSRFSSACGASASGLTCSCWSSAATARSPLRRDARPLRGAWATFLVFFQAQAAFVAVFSIPALLASFNSSPEIEPLEWVGTAVWAVVTGEWIADRQLSRWKAKRAA